MGKQDSSNVHPPNVAPTPGNHWAVKLRFRKDGEQKMGSGFFINLHPNIENYHLILTAAHNLTNLQGVHTTDLEVISNIPGVGAIKIDNSDWSNVFISKSYVGNGKPETDYGAILVPKPNLKVTGFGFSMKLAYEKTFKEKISVTGWRKSDRGRGEYLYTSSNVCTACHPNRVEYATKTKEEMSGCAVYIEYKDTYAAIAIHNNATAVKGSSGSGVRLTPELLCEIFTWASPKLVFKDVQVGAKDIRKQAKDTTPSLFLSFMDGDSGRARLGSGSNFDVMPTEIMAGYSNLYAMSTTHTGKGGKQEWVTFNPNSTTKKVGLSEAMIDSCLFEKISENGISFKIVASSGTVNFQLRMKGQEGGKTDRKTESSEVSWVRWPAGDNELFTNFVFSEKAQDFKTNLNDYVKENKFEKFFLPNDPFLQKIATKADALRNDPTTDLGKPENIGRLTRLSLYQPVIYCDDSASMGGYPERYRNQRDLVMRIARIATKIVPDDMAGVDLCFINTPGLKRLDANVIGRAIDAVEPAGGTKIGTQLREKILKPLVYDVISKSKPTTPIPFKRPLLICTITDGCPYPEPTDTLTKTVLECKQKLVAAGYDPTAVMFLISQVGTDNSAAEFLNTLRSEPRIQDVVYVTAETLDKQYKELKQNERELESWLLRLLTKPIMDRRQ